MAANSTFNGLSNTVDAWLQRMRLQRALTWAVRGLNLGLAVGSVAGAAGLFQARLLRPQFVILVGTLALATPLLMAIIAYAWPMRRLQAARRLDRMLGLRERVSTAFEFDEEQRAANPLLQQQLEDATRAAQKVRPGRDLPLRMRTLEAIPALVLVLLIGLTWVRGESWFQAAQRAATVKQAVTEQQKSIEAILSQIQKTDTLTEEQKKALSQPLQNALQNLQKNPTLESSVSVLSSTAEQLQGLSDPQAQQMGEALQQAGNQLAGQNGSPLQSVGQALANGNPISAASQLQQVDPSKLSQTEAQQLASQLQSLSQAVSSSNPALASQLQQAAQALQNGDAAAAQQALQNAAKSLTQAGQQMTFSQMAGQAGQAMQQGTGQVLAAGGGQQPTTQGQGAGQGQSPGQGNSPGQGQSGANQGGGTNGTSSSGAGKGSGQGQQTGGQEAPNSPITQNNGPGDGGESTYEQIYAPKLLGGENGQTVTLPGSGQNGNVIGQGPTKPGASGQSMVPYQQVLGQYEQVNQQAIDNGSIPFEFMQVIHSYFNSLQP